MEKYIEGQDGVYKIKHRTKIYQYKRDKSGNISGECILHVMTDTIENDYDRHKVSKFIQSLVKQENTINLDFD